MAKEEGVDDILVYINNLKYVSENKNSFIHLIHLKFKW